ncbi:hypothetical protein ABFS82_03G044600 [Erythranthe guttata]|uniref:EF-hand domain-containing protein n=1 Tax=Erythranthe guttata TaxID=4155 RepID=A0A022QBT3_ERYGU|nr:PREDICTED: calcium-binding protein CML39-like [Erythranthe guttata]EYU25416.1 hypothetical protein MIMGU_mgv1a016979mg [Erythranthe guttata]|eukprot:XP_012851700.1 PREDICTED: calcium-binding protein CML39-like [Erythranthe guttata]
MAITTSRHRAPTDGKIEISVEEFKLWLKKFDTDKDGRISVEELRRAVRANGGWFSKSKAKRGVKLADKNFNGTIDDHEISNLMEFAEKHLGLRIIPTH